MSFLRLYGRVLALLAPEARLAITLAVANIALAVSQFVEPVLFGRIIDRLTGALPAGLDAAARVLAPLIGTWVGLGLFIVVSAALVAWFADRLAHRRRNMVTADFFEHVLQLPLAFHTAAHSGRQVKVMFSGTYTMWWLWLSFFGEYFAAFVFVCVLLPMTLVLNWRLAMPLLGLCLAFAALTALVVHKAFGLQRAVEQHYSAMAETAADALGNVALVQSYARIDREVSGLRDLVNALLNAQLRCSRGGPPRPC
jgi:ATP-binding cassette subfamily B protein